LILFPDFFAAAYFFLSYQGFRQKCFLEKFHFKITFSSGLYLEGAELLHGNIAENIFKTCLQYFEWILNYPSNFAR